MEGSSRMNRKNSVENRPKLPMKSDQSQNVEMKSPQEESRKSFVSDTAMITKRSSHMPTLTMMEMMNSARGLCLTRLNHSGWMATRLQKINAQKNCAWSPNMRFQIMKRSNSTPEYQAMKISTA